MNELMILIGGGQWMYYKTMQATADKAFQRFNEACDIMEVNMDNVTVKEVTLRNKTGDDIDKITF